MSPGKGEVGNKTFNTSWLFQSFILLMKFITGPSENIKNSLILTFLHLCPNRCPRVSKCFSLLKKPHLFLHYCCVLQQNLKPLMESTQQKVSIPRTTQKHEHVFSKGPFLYHLFNEQGGKKTQTTKYHPITSLPSINEFTPLSQEANPFNKYQRELRGAGIPRGGKGGAAAAVCNACGGPVLPRGSVQGDDVGRAAATTAGDDAGVGPARGANVRAALVVAGGGDDAARRAAC